MNPPEPRDPRMDRGGDAALSVKVDDGDGLVELNFTREELQRLRWTVRGLAAAVFVMAVALSVMIPRSWGYERTLDENLRLKEQISDLDQKMQEVDRAMLRMRLYESQLRSLGEPKGDHGPLSPEDFANYRLDQLGEGLDAGQGIEWAEGQIAPADLMAADTWADAVRYRADTFLALFEEAEPHLNQLVVELEDLRALDAALPSQWPAEGTFTSGFGWRRNPALNRAYRFHSGIDVANRRGTPIVAAADGVVIKARYNSGYGRMVEVDHGFGITTLYAHCTRLTVKEGQRVKKGDQVGTIGSTGRSTGPHLHFEVRLDGHAVDPLDYLPR